MIRGPLRIALADDESVARRRLVRLLREMDGVALVAEFADGDQILRALQDGLEADVLLLDIRMPTLSGLEARTQMGDEAPYVILTTAHSEHALDAFEAGAEDYLLKPIEAQRLKRALDRARHRLGQTPALATERVGRFGVQTSKGLVLVDPERLSHATFDGSLTTLATHNGPVLTELSLQQLEERLPPATFVRVHRRAIVNLSFVERLEPTANGNFRAHLSGGADVTVSRQAGRRLRRRFGG